MPRKVVRKERGVFEKVPGSDIWWIRFKVAGVEHREKVGRRGDAIKLYKIRKADILRGVKMPANMKDKGIKFSVLAQEAIDWSVNHDRRDVRNFKGRMKFILEAFADRVADEIKPSDIDTWISSHKWSAATKNRYKMSSEKRSRLRWQTVKSRAILREWLSNARRIMPAFGSCQQARKRDCAQQSRKGSRSTCRNSM